MSTIDYPLWIDRLRKFTGKLHQLSGEIDVIAEISPTVSEEMLSYISRKWKGGLPTALRRFWSEGASGIDCKYSWRPQEGDLPRLQEIFESTDSICGGVRFEPAASIYPGNSGAVPNDECMRETVGQAGLELWCRCAVFLHVGNGDCLGLDPTTNPDDPAVIYLFHDGEESGQISPTFSQFLLAWEELSYIGPECWLLDYWLDWDLGTIDCTKHKTAELRRLLTPAP